MKVLFALGILGSLLWYVSQELDLGETDVASTPSVQYPVADTGVGVGSAGQGTAGALRGP